MIPAIVAVPVGGFKDPGAFPKNFHTALDSGQRMIIH
jgi:hypothetical protein